MKRYTVFGVLAALALLVTLLTPRISHAQAAPQTINVNLSEFKIDSNSLTVTVGQTVHFEVQNIGKYPHNLTFMKGDKMMNLFAKPLTGGSSGTADFTFTEAGTWDMYCPVGNHAAMGMTGQVIVMPATFVGMPSTGAGDSITQFAALAALLSLALVAGGLFMRRRWTSAE